MKLRDYQELLDFQQTNDCQMAYLTRALDDPHSRKCGKCSTCVGNHWNWTNDKLSIEEIEKVFTFFAKDFIIIEPREKINDL